MKQCEGQGWYLAWDSFLFRLHFLFRYGESPHATSLGWGERVYESKLRLGDSYHYLTYLTATTIALPTLCPLLTPFWPPPQQLPLLSWRNEGPKIGLSFMG